MNARRILLTVALLLAGAPLVAGTSPEAVTTERAWTRIVFDSSILASFGIEVDAPGGRFEFEAVAPSGFVVDAAGGDFEGFAGGSLRHVDGFRLRFGGHVVSMSGFEIRPGTETLTLDLFDARGRRLFIGDQMHFAYDAAAGRLRLENVDLRISPELATLLQAPDLARIALGRLELEATTHVVSPAIQGATCTSCSAPVWVGDVDVHLNELTNVQQIARPSGKVTVTLSSKLENVGTADVAWWRKFTGTFPPYGNDQHPFLVWAFYRIAPISGSPGAPTAIEMLGQSALKHAFFSTNTDCFCQGDQILFAPIGNGCTCGGPEACTHDSNPCSDTYGSSTNNDPNSLGPRDELEAHSGIWIGTGSFFDQDSDGKCDWDTGSSPGNDCGNLPFSGDLDRRLAVPESELSTAGASYFVDAWYLVRDDIDIFNTMGWRQITPAFTSFWSFPTTTALAAGSVLDAWVSRAAQPAGASHERIDTGVGELSLAVKTTALGGDDYHYEYALANHDFDRKVQSVRIPLLPPATISNVVFRDLDDQAANDWIATVDVDAITFQAPADANTTALDWGTLFSFGFDADVAPSAGSVDLGALEETPSLLFAAPAVTPGGASGSAIFFDDFESGGSTRWIVGEE